MNLEKRLGVRKNPVRTAPFNNQEGPKTASEVNSEDSHSQRPPSVSQRKEKASLFYSSSEEDGSEEPYLDNIFEKRCSAALSRKSISVNLKETKVFKKNIHNDQPNNSTISHSNTQIEDVSKVFKMISKPSPFSDVTKNKSLHKLAVRTYGSPRSLPKKFVIESFGLPDTPIVPEVPMNKGTLLDAEAVSRENVTVANCQSLDETQEPLQKCDRNVDVSVMTSPKLDITSVVSAPKSSSSKNLIEIMKNNIRMLLIECKPTEQEQNLCVQSKKTTQSDLISKEIKFRKTSLKCEVKSFKTRARSLESCSDGGVIEFRDKLRSAKDKSEGGKPVRKEHCVFKTRTVDILRRTRVQEGSHIEQSLGNKTLLQNDQKSSLPVKQKKKQNRELQIILNRISLSNLPIKFDNCVSESDIRNFDHGSQISGLSRAKSDGNLYKKVCSENNVLNSIMSDWENCESDDGCLDTQEITPTRNSTPQRRAGIRKKLVYHADLIANTNNEEIEIISFQETGNVSETLKAEETFNYPRKSFENKQVDDYSTEVQNKSLRNDQVSQTSAEEDMYTFSDISQCNLGLESLNNQINNGCESKSMRDHVIYDELVTKTCDKKLTENEELLEPALALICKRVPSIQSRMNSVESHKTIRSILFEEDSNTEENVYNVLPEGRVSNQKIIGMLGNDNLEQKTAAVQEQNKSFSESGNKNNTDKNAHTSHETEDKEKCGSVSSEQEVSSKVETVSKISDDNEEAVASKNQLSGQWHTRLRRKEAISRENKKLGENVFSGEEAAAVCFNLIESLADKNTLESFGKNIQDVAVMADVDTRTENESEVNSATSDTLKEGSDNEENIADLFNNSLQSMCLKDVAEPISEDLAKENCEKSNKYFLKGKNTVQGFRMSEEMQKAGLVKENIYNQPIQQLDDMEMDNMDSKIHTHCKESCHAKFRTMNIVFQKNAQHQRKPSKLKKQENDISVSCSIGEGETGQQVLINSDQTKQETFCTENMLNSTMSELTIIQRPKKCTRSSFEIKNNTEKTVVATKVQELKKTNKKSSNNIESSEKTIEIGAVKVLQSDKSEKTNKSQTFIAHQETDSKIENAVKMKQTKEANEGFDTLNYTLDIPAENPAKKGTDYTFTKKITEDQQFLTRQSAVHFIPQDQHIEDISKGSESVKCDDEKVTRLDEGQPKSRFSGKIKGVDKDVLNQGQEVLQNLSGAGTNIELNSPKEFISQNVSKLVHQELATNQNSRLQAGNGIYGIVEAAGIGSANARHKEQGAKVRRKGKVPSPHKKRPNTRGIEKNVKELSGFEIEDISVLNQPREVLQNTDKEGTNGKDNEKVKSQSVVELTSQESSIYQLFPHHDENELLKPSNESSTDRENERMKEIVRNLGSVERVLRSRRNLDNKGNKENEKGPRPEIEHRNGMSTEIEHKTESNYHQKNPESYKNTEKFMSHIEELLPQESGPSKFFELNKETVSRTLVDYEIESDEIVEKTGDITKKQYKDLQSVNWDTEELHSQSVVKPTSLELCIDQVSSLDGENGSLKPLNENNIDSDNANSMCHFSQPGSAERVLRSGRRVTDKENRENEKGGRPEIEVKEDENYPQKNVESNRDSDKFMPQYINELNVGKQSPDKGLELNKYNTSRKPFKCDIECDNVVEKTGDVTEKQHKYIQSGKENAEKSIHSQSVGELTSQGLSTGQVSSFDAENDLLKPSNENDVDSDNIKLKYYFSEPVSVERVLRSGRRVRDYKSNKESEKELRPEIEHKKYLKHHQKSVNSSRDFEKFISLNINELIPQESGPGKVFEQAKENVAGEPVDYKIACDEIFEKTGCNDVQRVAEPSEVIEYSKDLKLADLNSFLLDDLDLNQIEADVGSPPYNKSDSKFNDVRKNGKIVEKMTRSKSRMTLNKSLRLLRSKSSLGIPVSQEDDQKRVRGRPKMSLGFKEVSRRIKRSQSVVPNLRKLKKEEKKERTILSYRIGSLMWAQIGTYPFWPCLVTKDVESVSFTKLVTRRTPSIYCHVRFFGDNGKRAWINESKLMMYRNKTDLEMIHQAKKEEGYSTAAELQAYIVKPAIFKKWEIAVSEAESVKFRTSIERVKFFDVIIPKKQKDQSPDSKPSIEKVSSKSSAEAPLKRKLTTSLSRKSEEPADECEEEGALDKSPIHKRRKKDSDKMFEEKDKKSSDQTCPKSETELNRDFKKKVWSPNKTNATTKEEPQPLIEPPYVPILDNENILPSRLRTRKQEESPEIITKPVSQIPNLTLATDMYSTETQKTLFRRNHLFKGISKEKVCQYCFTPDDVFKCRGGCNSLYHVSCAADVLIEKPVHLRRRKRSSLSKSGTKLDSSFTEDQLKNEKNSKPFSSIQETRNDFEDDEKLLLEDHVQIITVPSTIYNTPPRKNFPENFSTMSLSEQIDYKMKEVMRKFENSVYAEPYTDLSSEENSTPFGTPMKQTSFSEVSNSAVVNGDIVRNIGETVKLRHKDDRQEKKAPILEKKMSKSTSTKHVTADSEVIDVYVASQKSKSREEFSAKLVAKKHVTADFEPFELTPSESSCSSVSHQSKDRVNPLDFKCGFCTTGIDPYCFVCNKAISKLGSTIRQKCSLYQCSRFYHPECLKQWPQTQWSLIQTTKHKDSHKEIDSFVCPQHVCHTCASDDPRAAMSRCPGDKIVRCLRCPSTYHSTNFCVPAGTEILSATQIVCPRHRSKLHTINTTWCFLCNEGGNLICCETCPTSVHPECMPVNLNEDDKFICEDCESGRLPLYDEIVWVKLGKYKWWPGLILFPNEIPLNVMNLKHSLGEFVVKFFGTHDHYWVNRGRSFLFQEGDTGQTNGKGKVDITFQKAVEEAMVAHMAKKEFKNTREAENMNSLKPPPYIKIKSNRPVGSVRLLDLDLSNTTPCECNPSQANPCGPDSDCLNRLLLTECCPEVCLAGDKCKNQSFEKREYPLMVPYKTQGRGWGLKSLAPIKKGQFVIEYVGEVIDDAEYQRRIQKMHEQKEENYYFLTIDKDRMIDAGPKGNVARFMNHCCQPNCETQKWTVRGDTRVGLFATVDIPAGTELTFNYNLECIGKEKKICKCGAPNCSGYIGVKTKQDTESKKPKKPPKKKKPVEHTILPPCFVCGRSGNVRLCNNKICAKAYHLRCVNLTKWPEGNKFVCSWHNCNVCSKRTIRCCVKCIWSFCPLHSEGNIRYDNLLGFVCNRHDPTKPLSYSENLTSSRRKKNNVITEETAVTSTTSDDSENEVDDTSLLERYMKEKSQSVDNFADVPHSTPIKGSKSEYHDNRVSSINSTSLDEIALPKRRSSPKKDEMVRKKSKLGDSQNQNSTARSEGSSSRRDLDL